ncbi:MAG: lytic transglycosylase domain-containing protein [Sulfuricaulis sp.]
MEVGKKTLVILAIAVIAGFTVTHPAWAANATAKEEAAVDPALRVLVKKAALDTDSFRDRFDGEVWLADMSRRLEKRVPDAPYRVELLKTVHYEAHRSGLPPELVLAVIDVESNFSQYAISRAGARGLMQVMPFWLNIIGRPGDSLFRMQTNLRLGCTILKYYLDKEKGNLQAALKRYNGTRERAYAMRVDKLLRTRWFRQ